MSCNDIDFGMSLDVSGDPAFDHVHADHLWVQVLVHNESFIDFFRFQETQISDVLGVGIAFFRDRKLYNPTEHSKYPVQWYIH
jgi:hypothetical protein